MSATSAMYMGPASLLVIDGFEYPQGVLLVLDTSQAARVISSMELVNAGHHLAVYAAGSGGTAKQHKS